jgi:hypothetical protein
MATVPSGEIFNPNGILLILNDLPAGRTKRPLGKIEKLLVSIPLYSLYTMELFSMFVWIDYMLLTKYI